MTEIIIDTSQEDLLKKELEKRTDAEAMRMKRYLSMPDLSRTKGHPLNEMVERILKVESLKNLDVIKIPEIVPAYVLFDLFNMPPGHPARSTSDTYYVNPENLLTTHDTVFWHYYLNHPEIKERINKRQPIGAVCFAKVYRKDEIDRHHMNVFHQIGALYLVPDDQKTLNVVDLKNVLTEIAQSIFGKEVKIRFNEDNFPYTDPSLEMEIEINGQWIEMLGSGMAKKSVLANFGLEGYHGWAFGFGLERLAIVSMELPDIRLLWSKDPRVVKQLMLGNKFKEVSKYPPITRDISFIVNNDFAPNNYFDLIRDIAGDLAEEVELLDKYENEEKFGKDKVSYTYRIIYRSPDRTLKTEEVEPLQNKLIEETKKQFNADIR